MMHRVDEMSSTCCCRSSERVARADRAQPRGAAPPDVGWELSKLRSFQDPRARRCRYCGRAQLVAAQPILRGRRNGMGMIREKPKAIERSGPGSGTGTVNPTSDRC